MNAETKLARTEFAFLEICCLGNLDNCSFWNVGCLQLQRMQINLLEYPSPAPTTPSQKPSHGDIYGTKHGIIDLLVSKRLEKF